MYKSSITSYLQTHSYSRINLKAVLFDMDGVLFDSMKNHATAWNLAMQQYGMTLSREEAYMHEGRTGAGTINIVSQRERGYEASEEEIKQIYQTKSDIFNKLPKAERMPGAYEVLQKIKSEGLIPMVGDHTVLLAETLFYCQHLVPCRGGQAVDAADKLPYHHCTLVVRCDRCFLRTDSIIDHIRKALCLHIGQFLLPIEFRIIRLVRVFDIQHHLAQPALDRPDGCGSHGITPALPEARPPL